VCGSAPSGAFQRRKVDLLLSLATSAAAARARRGPPSPDPAARSRPFDQACCVENLSIRCLARLIVRLRPFAGGRAEVERASSIVTGDLSRAWRTMARRTCWRRRRCLSAPSELQAWIRKMETLEVHPAMCGATGLVLISTINLSISSILTCLSRRWRSTRPPTWSAYGGG
jgi:hypothetical protein